MWWWSGYFIRYLYCHAKFLKQLRVVTNNLQPLGAPIQDLSLASTCLTVVHASFWLACTSCRLLSPNHPCTWCAYVSQLKLADAFISSATAHCCWCTVLRDVMHCMQLSISCLSSIDLHDCSRGVSCPVHLHAAQVKWLLIGWICPVQWLPPCKDTRCKDTLDVRTVQLGINHGILTAMAPLIKDNLVQGLSSSQPKQSLQKEELLYV